MLFEATGVTKRFGDTTAVDSLSLSVERGQVLALLGRNGAGKTTVVNMLATLCRPDAGTLCVYGTDVEKQPTAVRGMIGLAGQNATVEAMLTGRENLEIIAALYGLGRQAARRATERVLDEFGLTDAADKRVGSYSGGMRRKLDLGATMVGSPSFLLLDEPTTGLDPASRHDLWRRVRGLVEAGTDVLLTTQYLEEADQLADRVVVLDRGRILADGSPGELKQSHAHSLIDVRVQPAGEIAEIARHLARAIARPDGDGNPGPAVDTETGTAIWSTDHPARETAAIFRAAEAASVQIEEVTVRQPTLEEAYLHLTGNHSPRAADHADVDVDRQDAKP